MALARLNRQAKRPYGFCAKMTAAAVMGLCFIVLWSVFSSSSTSVTVQRQSFDDIGEPAPRNTKVRTFQPKSDKKGVQKHESSEKVKSESEWEKSVRKVNASVSSSATEHKSDKKRREPAHKKKEKEKKKLPKGEAKGNDGSEESEDEDSQTEKEDEDEEGIVVDGKEQVLDREEGEVTEDAEGEEVDRDSEETLENEGGESSKGSKKTKKIKGPLFEPKALYNWKLCNTKSKHNYIPCIDYEVGSGYRHTERSCPRTPPICLVPLPHNGYGAPVRWPESREKVYKCAALHSFLLQSHTRGDASFF